MLYLSFCNMLLACLARASLCVVSFLCAFQIAANASNPNWWPCLSKLDFSEMLFLSRQSQEDYKNSQLRTAPCQELNAIGLQFINIRILLKGKPMIRHCAPLPLFSCPFYRPGRNLRMFLIAPLQSIYLMRTDMFGFSKGIHG